MHFPSLQIHRSKFLNYITFVDRGSEIVKCQVRDSLHNGTLATPTHYDRLKVTAAAQMTILGPLKLLHLPFEPFQRLSDLVACFHFQRKNMNQPTTYRSITNVITVPRMILFFFFTS